MVAVAIVGVLRIALKDPDQPATMRAPTRRHRPEPAADVSMSAQPVAVGAMPLPERTAATARRPTGGGGGPVWARVRSGIALVVLVAVVGAMVALAVGAVLVGGALALRSAVS